jgi:hypothetical protein
MVSRGLDGKRQLPRTGLRQGASCYREERLVSRRLARERELLRPLRIRSCEPSWQQRANVWRKAESKGQGFAVLG